ncbi:MFS general substrate transporter [Aureobasidium sp. EXF-10727]|nr:MFS general substrate transporter [Aureobasidium sp. EXF-10727]KAI4725285.1 MFS general substrate transporter [Aureobasidium sp. EXF-10728]
MPRDHDQDSIELAEVFAADRTEPRSHQISSKSSLDKQTLLRLISAGFSFFVAGVNDGSLGALIPWYGASFFGWFTAALTNTHLSQYLDLGAMLVLGAVLQVLAQALRAWPTPFGLYVTTFWLTCVGQAYQDTHANAYTAVAAKGAHRWLGFIHAAYMAGCLVGPFAASPIASSRGSNSLSSPWYFFYTIPLGLGILNITFCLVAFSDTLRLKPRAKASTSRHDQASLDPVEPTEHVPNDQSAMSVIKKTLMERSFWNLSLFYFFYLGATITASGWVVEYLVNVRKGSIAAMGYVPAGFSGGALLGRLLLPEPTRRFGERLMVTIYCLICIGLQIMFWLSVPNTIAAAVAISLVGFFSGPLFATGISVGSRLFPAEIRSTALSLVFVFAQIGGSLFPVITGLVSSSKGVWVLQPMLVGLISATAISWLLVPQPKSSNVELHQE